MTASSRGLLTPRAPTNTGFSCAAAPKPKSEPMPSPPLRPSLSALDSPPTPAVAPPEVQSKPTPPARSPRTGSPAVAPPPAATCPSPPVTAAFHSKLTKRSKWARAASACRSTRSGTRRK
eukprot:scaffold23449_cov131-Isochrysis_galbana.AAC.2